MHPWVMPWPRDIMAMGGEGWHELVMSWLQGVPHRVMPQPADIMAGEVGIASLCDVTAW